MKTARQCIDEFSSGNQTLADAIYYAWQEGTKAGQQELATVRAELAEVKLDVEREFGNANACARQRDALLVAVRARGWPCPNVACDVDICKIIRAAEEKL